MAVQVARSMAGYPFCEPTVVYDAEIPEEFIEDEGLQLAKKELTLCGYEVAPLDGVVMVLVEGPNINRYRDPTTYRVCLTWAQTEISRCWHIMVDEDHGQGEAVARYAYPEFDDAWDKFKELIDNPVKQR